MDNKAIQNLLLNRTKTKIIETAERLFAEKGINNVSTSCLLYTSDAADD